MTPGGASQHAALAAQIQARLGGTLSPSAKGLGFRINLDRRALDTPDGYRGQRIVLIRVMDRGRSRTNFWRMSVEGQGGVTAGGTLSDIQSLTHHAIGPTALSDILRAFDLLTGGWR
jgi:hypothetical protein